MVDNKIQVLLVSSQQMVRECLRQLLKMDNENEIDLVGVAANGIEAVCKAQTNFPDVVLLNLEVSYEQCVEAIFSIKANSHAQILVLSESIDEEVITIMKSGALGYLSKNASYSELQRAIKCVHEGEAYLSPSCARTIILWVKGLQISQQTPLSPRETEVLMYAARGLTNKEIARRLHIKADTARAYMCNIFAKLNLDNRTQAVRYALASGIVNMSQN